MFGAVPKPKKHAPTLLPPNELCLSREWTTFDHLDQ